MRRLTFLLVPILVLFSLSVEVVAQETQTDQCTALHHRNLEQQSASCSDMLAGNVCPVADTSISGTEDSSLLPGDITSTSPIEAISTSGLQLEDTWGMAEIRTHADIPLLVSRLGASLVFFGAVDVQNLVNEEQAFVPVEPVTVQVIVSAANIRLTPHMDAIVMYNAGFGDELFADGLSTDGEWLRITLEGEALWISRRLVASDSDLDALPVVENVFQASYQNICLATGQGSGECTSLPDGILMVQSPPTDGASIMINGMVFRGLATYALRILPDNQMQLLVIDGTVYTGGVAAPRGGTMTIALAETGCQTTGRWERLRPINAEERSLLMSMVPFAPQYPITVPDEQEIAAIWSAAGRNNAATGSCATFSQAWPQESMGFGPVVFYWDGVANAHDYVIWIYDGGGNVISKHQTFGAQTNIQIDTRSFGDGRDYSWQVLALDENGQYLCGTDLQLSRRDPMPSSGGSSVASRTGSAGGSSNDDNNPGVVPCCGYSYSGSGSMTYNGATSMAPIAGGSQSQDVSGVPNIDINYSPISNTTTNSTSGTTYTTGGN